MSHFPIDKDDMLAAFADGKIPSAYYWQTLITGMYDTATDVADLQEKHAEVVQYYNYILELSNTIDTQYNQIEIWHGDVDAWQQAVSQNTAITEANKTASQTLKADTEAAASAAAQSERNAGQQASIATTEAARAVQAKTDADTAASHAAASQRASAESAGQSSASATAAANASATAVQAREDAEAAATQAQASQTAAQSSASEASASKDAAKNSETRASNEADRSKLEADRSHNEADRAERAASSITDIPDQTGHSGQFLATDGSTADWQPIPEGLPPQAGNDGKFLQTDGADASWQEVALGVPVGTFLPLGMKAAEMGYLPADGQQYNKDDYPALWKKAHDNQWPGVTDTTFIVPDYRGLGVTGYDPTGIIDPDNVGREFLTKQLDGIRNFTGTIGSDNSGSIWTGWTHTLPEDAPTGVFSSSSPQSNTMRPSSGFTTVTANKYITIDASRAVPTASVNRINNINPLWVVKAYDVVLAPEQLQAKAVIDQVNGNAAELLIVKEKTNTIGYKLLDFGDIVINTRYVKANPFGTCPVIVSAEILVGDLWSEVDFIYSNGGWGTKATWVQRNSNNLDNVICVQTGTSHLSAGAADCGSGAANDITQPVSKAKCRVHVWRVGV